MITKFHESFQFMACIYLRLVSSFMLTYANEVKRILLVRHKQRKQKCQNMKLLTKHSERVSSTEKRLRTFQFSKRKTNFGYVAAKKLVAWGLFVPGVRLLSVIPQIWVWNTTQQLGKKTQTWRVFLETSENNSGPKNCYLQLVYESTL